MGISLAEAPHLSLSCLGVLEEKSISSTDRASLRLIHTGMGQADKNEMVSLVEAAQHSIDIYTYTFNDRRLAKLLNQKAAQGVKVTLHIDKSQVHTLERMLGNKITIAIQDCKSGLFHHKTMVIDQKKVWMGSGNFTHDAFTSQWNFFQSIQSAKLAEAITDVFKKTASNNYTFTEKIGKREIEYWHLPANEGRVSSPQARQNVQGLKRLCSLMRCAKKSIRIANACLSNYKLIDEMVRAQERGIQVEFFYNPESAICDAHLVIEKLKKAGVKVVANTSSKMHHLKMMICDDEVFVNGSPNWSSSSFSRNDESFLIIKSCSKTQRKTLKTFWNTLTQV